MEEHTFKNERFASRALEEYLAKRIANVSSADWKTTPKERRTEFLKAARRAVSGIRKYETVSAAREAKRQERREQAKARRVKAEVKTEEN